MRVHKISPPTYKLQEDPKSPAAIDSALHFAVAFSQRVVLLVLMRFVQKQKGREALAALLAARNSAGKTVFEEAEGWCFVQ